MSADGLRLTLEIVPGYIADRGLSSTLPKARWDRIRQRVAEGHGYRCAACGSAGRRGNPLQCHEVWEYDLSTVRPPTPDEVEARSSGGKTRWVWVGAKARESVRRGVRSLVGLMPLCGPCHRAKHSNWPCYTFPWVREELVALGSGLEPGDMLQWALAHRGTYFGGPARARFGKVNHGVPLAVLEAHCLEACALHDARRSVEWASDYNGFDRYGEG